MRETTVDFMDFILQYTAEDAHWLALDWNGKFGPKFKDENYFFRLQIADMVCTQISEVPIELIHELFVTLGKVAQLSFSVYAGYNLLAQALLERGGATYLFDYVCAAHISFDVFSSTGEIQLSSERKAELLVYFNHLKATIKEPQLNKMFSEQIRTRFLS